ncbi:hypothetical protein [Myroides marinus]|uniref:hypothetical protein n=1 Tax=Myroides marinus TaxID=703342 RepID=UPI0025763865|nr:hypothetical protein [Myroides marinus]MDM1380207.1 hypothetical protein [Myroides marinus]MDM1387435.1 hypothetical protein [Myroides marinus]MDM1394647.1 hypothetical protein [Myroides marinus]
MKKLSCIVLILFAGLFFTGCSSDDNGGSKAEQEWIKFVQKHLIGEWTPYQIDVKPIIGEAVFSSPYPHTPSCNKDLLVLKNDFTGNFNHYVQGCQMGVTNFKWNHRLGELSFKLENGTEIPMILLKKSEKVLVLAVPAKAVKQYLIPLFPQIEYIEESQLNLLFANITLVK